MGRHTLLIFFKEGKIKAVSERQIAFKKRNEQISSLHWRIHSELTRRSTIIFDCQLVVSNEKFKKKRRRRNQLEHATHESNIKVKFPFMWFFSSVIFTAFFSVRSLVRYCVRLLLLLSRRLVRASVKSSFLFVYTVLYSTYMKYRVCTV